MTVDVRCRPIDSWNGARTHWRDQRRASFSAAWTRVLAEFTRECEYLGATDVVIGLDLMPSKIRLDGWPKSDANPPPAVVVTFESTHGPLRYQCDRWDSWRSNLRAITLVMTRQRQVNEAGVGQADQIYRGFQAIGAESVAMTAMSPSDAAKLLIDLASMSGLADPCSLIGDRARVDEVWKRAARLHHPDAGGDEDTAKKINVARDILLRTAA